ncbi:MAG: DMT family transporter, partial [Bradyrhizobium sp.]|nr:DMT family transporter [Bradyrhizobium sp.]
WLPAVIILTVVALPSLRQAWPAIRPRLGGLIVGGAVGVGLFSYLLLGGAYQSLAIEVGFINATTPVWVLLLGLWMGGGKLTAGIKWGLALAFAGTLLIITRGHIEALTALQFSLGNLWSLLAAMSFAWFSIRVRDWSRTIAPLALTVVTAWSGLIVVMLPVYVVWIVMGGPWLVWNADETGFALKTIAFMALGPTMLGNLFYLYGVARIGPARAAAFLYLSPLFSAVLSIGWLGEQLAWYHIAGFAAIFSGLLVLGYPNSAPAPADRV